MARRQSAGLSRLELQMIGAALDRTAFVLRPFPEGAEAAEIEKALTSLRAKGLIHGTRRDPNLTQSGVDAARELAEAE